MQEQSIKLKKSGDHLIFWKDIFKAFYIYIANSIQEGQEVWLTISTSEPKRTAAQNRFYWMYIRVIADSTGEDEEALHEHFKNQFLAPKIKMFRGEELKIYPTTTQLSIKQFMLYIKEIERETEIPAPDTQLFGLDKHILQAHF